MTLSEFFSILSKQAKEKISEEGFWSGDADFHDIRHAHIFLEQLIDILKHDPRTRNTYQVRNLWAGVLKAKALNFDQFKDNHELRERLKTFLETPTRFKE